MKGKAWDNKKSLMEIHNKQFRRINWTPECKTQARGGRERHVRDPWLFMQTNWKLTSNLTSDLQQCTSMYVLRKAQKSVGRKNLRLKLLGCFISSEQCARRICHRSWARKAFYSYYEDTFFGPETCGQKGESKKMHGWDSCWKYPSERGLWFLFLSSHQPGAIPRCTPKCV